MQSCQICKRFTVSELNPSHNRPQTKRIKKEVLCNIFHIVINLCPPLTEESLLCDNHRTCSTEEEGKATFNVLTGPGIFRHLDLTP